MIKDGIDLRETDLCSFLLVGQSNMAGRGNVADAPPVNTKNCYVLRMGRWQPLFEPVNPDRAFSGIGPGGSFAEAVAAHTGGRVGLIPCADGGTCIDQWMPGEVLFDHAVVMAKLAMRSSRLCGILWHQGESDGKSDEMALAHKAKFLTMITALRQALGAQDIPLLIGELCEELGPQYHVEDRMALINRQYRELAAELPRCGMVSAASLTLKEDRLHFDAVSQREFGRRYFEVFKSL